MQKSFDKWNTVKKEVDGNGLPKLYHTREIWWCSLGVNIGFEQMEEARNTKDQLLY